MSVRRDISPLQIPGDEVAVLATARVGDAYLRPAVIVSATTTLRQAVLAMKAEQVSCILVESTSLATTDDLHPAPQHIALGILTDQDMRDHAIINGVPPDAEVSALARPIQLVVSPDTALFDALPLLTQNAGHRVVVAENGHVRGVLELSDALALLANNSHGIALAIDRAASPDGLVEPSRDINTLIRILHTTGVKTAFIAQMVTTLNRRLMRRLFTLVATPALLANSCLMVMGSEGRGEQILKTDQDNGLILRDDVPIPDLAAILTAFGRGLEACGYPPCPGGVMASNPQWSKPLEGHKRALFNWTHSPDEAGLMNVAIFFDAAPVAGDVGLLDAAKEYLLSGIRDDHGFFLNFARPIGAFDTPSLSGIADWFGHRRGGPLDIKKAAIFPLIHGARAYALEARVAATSTVDRLQALAERDVLRPSFTAELTDTLSFLNHLRLEARLRGWSEERGNMVDPAQLSASDYERLKKGLGLVRRFKQMVAQHFHLDLH